MINQLVVLLLSCWVGLIQGLRGDSSGEDLPGWLGENHHSNTLHPISIGGSGVEWSGHIEQLTWSPRAYLLHNFLTYEECDHLINKASAHLTKSSVVDSSTGKSMDSDVRTSEGTFFARGGDSIIKTIEQRVAEVSMLPEENQEGMQILRYRDGQKYEPHHDYFHDELNARPEHGGQRVVTVLMYLSNVTRGGETVFPNAEKKVQGDEWSSCALEGNAVKAIKGNALMFYSLHPDGKPDPTSLHGSCPTLEGTKWSATKWIHTGGFDKSSRYQKSKWGDCVDSFEDEMKCFEWANAGECQKNKDFMAVYCKKSCHLCKH